MSGASMQRHEVARIAVQQRGNHKRSEKIVRRGRGHRRAETFSVPVRSLAISIQRISRLADPRTGGGTEKPRRSDAFPGKKFKFLFAAQRALAGGDLGKENRAPSENHDSCIEAILALLRYALLFWHRRIGKVSRLRGPRAKFVRELFALQRANRPCIFSQPKTARFGIRNPRIGTPGECSSVPPCA